MTARSRMPVRSLLLLGLLGLVGSAATGEQPPAVEKAAESREFVLTSAAFQDSAMIPEKYSCEGEDLSPPLAWTEPPEGTKSLALLCEDPDAPRGIWVHWVLWGLPGDTAALPEGMAREAVLSPGIQQGRNSWGRIGYGGPCPPPGPAHRYFFRLFALDTLLALEVGADRTALLRAVGEHSLGEAGLMGRFKR